MTLYIGNPTNVIVAQAYNISFVKYSAWMLGPTIVSIILAYIFLRIVFRNPKFIPQKVDPPKHDPKNVLKDKRVWVVTLPFAVVSFSKDLVHDLLIKKKFRSSTDEIHKQKNKEESSQDTVLEN
ncbi:16752_t:CDS:2, partial [Acaulospora colombiana]